MFKISALNPTTKDTAVFLYDAHTSSLTDAQGRNLVDITEQYEGVQGVLTTSKETPNGKVTPRLLKISLGLSCNYECEYCSQRFVPRAGETNKDDIQPFLDGLDNWVTEPPERIEFWGGEPFVYWKTLKPLAEALRVKYPDAEFSVITNGSLLTKEINNWIVALGFRVGISHDGPGQSVRGPDPLDDPENREAILSLYRRLAPLGRISFNSMMNRENTSRAAVQKFFIDLTGDQAVPIGEGTFVDAYDEGGLASSLRQSEIHKYRNDTFRDIRTGKATNFATITQKMVTFIESLRTARPSSVLGQKCGMDQQDSIAVDLRGNVLTCQNVSSKGMAPNGESHVIGTTDNLGAARLTTSTHWSHRDECGKCPVLQICAGACMFLEGDLWEATCNNAYSDNVVVFAAAIEFLTGYVPMKIEGPHRADRHDIWKAPAGVVETPKKKIIPIAIAA